MRDGDAVVPDAIEGASPTSFDQIVAEIQFFSDSDSNHDNLDETETITSDVGIIDLYSDSEQGKEDAGCVEEPGNDSVAATFDDSNDVGHESATESAQEMARLNARVFKLLDRLDKLMRSPHRDYRLTGQKRTFIMALKGDPRADDNSEQVSGGDQGRFQDDGVGASRGSGSEEAARPSASRLGCDLEAA